MKCQAFNINYKRHIMNSLLEVEQEDKTDQYKHIANFVSNAFVS